MAFYNRVWVSSVTTGTGTLSLASATPGYQTFAGAGVPNGATVSYLIRDGVNNWEIGQGVYASAGPTLTRPGTGNFFSSTGSLLNLSGSETIILTPQAADYAALAPLASPTFTGTVNAAAIIGTTGAGVSPLTANGPGARLIVGFAGSADNYYSANNHYFQLGDNATSIATLSSTGVSVTGAITANTYLKSGTYTVATLPSASAAGAGARVAVTDALAPTLTATVVGGGAVFTPVISDGTNWKVG